MEKVAVVAVGCWLWLGGLCRGYGIFSVGRRSEGTFRSVRAHRWAYEHFVGPIPPGYEVDHVKTRGCTSTRCVNPEHLEAVPQIVNIMRSDCGGAVNSRKTHCINGHALSGDNLVPRKNGKRQCRECKNARYLASRK